MNPSRALRERLPTLEAERDQIEAEIADVVPPTVEFHPNAANAYREKVRDLKKALAESDGDNRTAAHDALREIVGKVVIHPKGPYKPRGGRDLLRNRQKTSGSRSESSEPEGQELLYSTRIALDRTQMQIEDKLVNLTPGMALTVEIKTGKRRLIEYLMSPLLRYWQESLRER